MARTRLDSALDAEVLDLTRSGTSKGDELVIVGVDPPQDGFGPRFLLAGSSQRFLRMNSNSYLGLSRHPALVEAEESATRVFGAGPGAVRFISGTYAAHRDLEDAIGRFHRRPGAMIYSSAYAAVVSTLTSLITPETVVLSDGLNHNCIINGLRMSRPAHREVYPHLDYSDLEAKLQAAAGQGKRAMIISDGVFSMRGDFADLSALGEIARDHDDRFEEGVTLVIDDSHGVGAFGETGRGTEEVTGGDADILIGTLGKAFGVNGGYVTGSGSLTGYLREKAPMYIYSNPITVGEAAAATASMAVVDSDEGRGLLRYLAEITAHLETGLVDLGLETIPGPHPVVPMMIRDTDRTRAMVDHLFQSGILATGLNHPVVPRGDEEIRFQVNADHTGSDIDYLLEVLARFG
jgi:glycine C-acetyltransferase